MNIREATKIYLRATGQTQKELASLIDVHPVTLSAYLNRTSGPSLAEKLAPIVYSVPQTTAATGQAQSHD